MADKFKNDPYSNPDILKEDFIYPDGVEQKKKQGGRAVWIFVLLFIPIFFLLGSLLFLRRDDEVVIIDETSTQTNDTLSPIVVSTKSSPTPAEESEESDSEEIWLLDQIQVTTAEGTFTQWLAGVPVEEMPRYKDIAYHAGTSAIYLLSTYQDGLYVIPNNDGNYTTITWLDLSLRIDKPINQVLSFDDDHLLLLVDSDDQFALYNVAEDRVVSSWPSRYQPDAPDTYYSIYEGDVAVSKDGLIYVLQSVEAGETYQDEIQVFSNTGDYLSTLIPPKNYLEFMMVSPDNVLFVYDYRERFEYNPQTETWREVELLPAFTHAHAAEFHPNGSLYASGSSNAWLAEELPNGQVGIAYPATEATISRITEWPIGKTGDPNTMTILPDGSFVFIDSYSNNFQRIFRLELPTP